MCGAPTLAADHGDQLVPIPNSKIHYDDPYSKTSECRASVCAACRRENEKRWREMQAEFTTDSDAMEQWAATAKLRRLEVERLEAVLAAAERA